MSQELHTEALSFSRKMIAASSAITARKACIHSLTRADVTLARKVIREQKEKGEDLSFTAYVVLCLARALSEFPEMNSYRRRNSLVFLPDLAVSVQVEREFNGARVPEPVIIRNGHQKSLSEITRELRNAKANPDGRMGGLSRAVWIRFIPGFCSRPLSVGPMVIRPWPGNSERSE
ncbi:MAG: 2-oxo acid dehydrogenase subunit E2 [Bacteroidales bacterium]